MPESLSSFWGVEGKKLEIAVTLKRACRVVVRPSLVTRAARLKFLWNAEAFVEGCNLSIWIPDFCDEHFLGKLLRDHGSDVERSCLEADTFFDIAVWQTDFDRLLRQGSIFYLLCVQKRVKVSETRAQELGLLLEFPLTSDELGSIVNRFCGGFFSTFVVLSLMRRFYHRLNLINRVIEI